MRIIGHIDDDKMKITLLEMNQRVSVKFEYNLMEQTFKLTESFDGNAVSILKERLTADVRSAILKSFENMSKHRLSLSPLLEADDDFPEII